MKKINVTFRKVKAGEFRDIIDCVFLDEWFDNHSDIVTCYSGEGSESRCSYSYFLKSTVPAKPDEYKQILKKIRVNYKGFKIVVHKSLTKKFFMHNGLT